MLTEHWSHYSEDIDFLITIEFAPGYTVSYFARQILEEKLAHIVCFVNTPHESTENHSWQQLLKKSTNAMQNFQDPISLRHCLADDFEKLPGKRRVIHMGQIMLDQIKIVLWCCIRLEPSRSEAPTSRKDNTSRLQLATPLHFAAFHGLQDVVTLLDKYGADLTYSSKDSLYSTPLIAGIWGLEQRSIKSRNDETIETLLRLDPTGKTIDISSTSGHLGVATPLNTAVKLYTGFMKHVGVISS